MHDPLDEAMLEPARLRAALKEAYGEVVDQGQVRVVRAPGRVNLIGEHTDYNDGLVLPVAIDLEVRLAVAMDDAGVVRLTRGDDGTEMSFEIDRIPEASGAWIDYVAGVCWSMSLAGLPVRGSRGIVASSVPIGAGLSSSAALELASAWALATADAATIAAMDLARIAQRAENEHVGVRCGLMDQFASACGVAGHALLLDCRSLEWRPVPLPVGLALVIIHSGVPRSLGSSAYNERRADCERAVATLAARDPAVRSLRDVDAALLEAARDEMEARAFRRAAHVIAENVRVGEAVVALEAGDDAALGRLFAESHRSLRDLYEVSCPELDVLVEIAAATPGVVATRMTGAGFGGCTVSLVRPDAIETLRRRIEAEYPGRTGRTPRLWRVSAVDGAGRAEA